MGNRLLFLAVMVAMFSSLAFAGPQVVVSDPICNGSEIALNSNAFSFTFNGQTSLTFCNTTSSAFTSLNFTISSPNLFDLGGFYCGAPDNPQTAAFDYCLVLDPNHANAGNNSQLFGGTLGVNPTEQVVHQFVTSYPLPVLGGSHDGPTDFYQNNDCYFGCQTNNVGSDMGSAVNLSFNLLDPLHIRPGICLALPLPNVPCGLLPGHEFTLTFDCDPNNTTTNNPCTSLPLGSGVSFQAAVNPNQVDFPAAVPEPATLMLVASAGIPAFLRRRKKL
jgi:hypothetical protein